MGIISISWIYKRDLEQLKAIYDWFILENINTWNHNWHAGHRYTSKKKQEIFDKNLAQSAILTRKLITAKNAEALALFQSESRKPKDHPDYVHRNFAAFISKGFLDNEEAFYKLLHDIYEQSPTACLNLVQGMIDVDHTKAALNDDFIQRCFELIDKIIQDEQHHNQMLLGRAYEMNFQWRQNEEYKQTAHSKLLALTNNIHLSQPAIAAGIIFLLFDYTAKNTPEHFSTLVHLFEEALHSLSEQEAYDNIYPNIVWGARFIEGSDQTENAVLSAMLKSEKCEPIRVVKGYTDLILQEQRSPDFKEKCMRRLDAIISNILLTDPDEAALMLSRIGQDCRHSGRNLDFPEPLKLLEPLLGKISKVSPMSIQKAKIVYGSHGSGALQHPKYIEIYNKFIQSRRL